MTEVEQFREYILQGKTIKDLQDIYGWTRTKVTDFKRLNGLVGLSPNSKKLDRKSGYKECSSCKETLSFSEFYSNGKTPAGTVKYKPQCIVCENKSRKSNFVDLLNTYLDTIGKKYECTKCGYTGVFGSLDFHHRNPREKSFNIGDGFNNSMSIERFMEVIIPELNKCDLLCPNCHRQEHLIMGLKQVRQGDK